MPAPQSLPSRLIGALFVERGLVSESQIRVALEIQRETGQQLGQVLVERFGVSRKELASVVAEQWAKLGGSAGPEDTASWRRLGDIFVERGFVTQEELDEALVRQRQTGERLGEALVAQGVISKFELAGALAEQMAVLGEPDAQEAAGNGQSEATVHQLHARDDTEEAPPATNVIELAAPVEWGTPQVEPDPPAVELPETPVEEEPDAASEALEPAQPKVEPEEEALPVEPQVEQVEEPQPVEAQVEHVEEPQPAHVEHVEEPQQVEAWVERVEEPQPAEVILTDLHEALLAEAGYANTIAPEPDPRTVCVAFAPTTDGYRLVALEAAPEPGETIDIAEVGEYLVLRVGSSPIPGDDRRCAYVEERVTPALIGAVAH
jgi:outer membrane biosynthesis protein TonB